MSVPARNTMPRRVAAAALLLALLALVAHSRVLTLEFVFDDEPTVLENPHLKDGLTIRSAAWAFGTFYFANWYPLTWISHALDVTLYGVRPWGHHLTSLLLHAANAALLFLILALLTEARGRSMAAAALFAVHPLHVESVAWIAERKDVLSTFFWLLAILLYLRHARRPRPAGMAPVAALMAFALMSKAMPVSLPFTLIILDWWPMGRLSPGSPGRVSGRVLLAAAREKWPLFVLTALSSTVTYLAQYLGHAVASWEVLPLRVRLANAAISYVAYLGKFLWPASLAALYEHPLGGIQLWKASAAAVFLAAVFLLAWRLRRGCPYAGAGWLWYILTLVPVIGLVQVGTQSMADRYTYVPLIGIYLIAVWGAADAAGRLRIGPRVTAVAGAVILLLFAAATRVQEGYWKNDLTLVGHTLEVTSNNWGAHNNMAFELHRLGRHDEALAHLSEAARLNPILVESLYYLGNLLVREGNIAEARKAYEETVKQDPGHLMARFSLGLTQARLGDYAAAAASYEVVVLIKPDFAEAWYQLGLALAQQGKLEEAAQALGRAAALWPSYPEAHYNLGSILEALGRREEARREFEEARRLNPALGAPDAGGGEAR